MLNYDFNILSPSEFECFTRDLLQASEKIRIGSFADGRDGGIDLSFAYDSTKKCIIQCKRYKQDWSKLKSNLNKEVSKVKTLNPDRYILATSVDLTAANKDEIKSMFAPYIKDTTTDILGKADLNNLLGQYPEIEKQYYKLWLGSTNVLDTIVHKNVINWSEFELDEIKSEIAKYVPNESFNKAQKILSENRYVIISGIPGIGKTTLARMLVYNFLAYEYEEFIYVVDDLDNASKVYDKNKKQVFFFDDFLGSNFFDIQKQSTSFENKLISFINRVKKSQNSLFIMTTREYILSDAKNYYEKIGLNNIEIAKCTIDLSHYTKIVRAQILYNHLAEANLPTKYIDVLVNEQVYVKLIQHRNFNPRIIEAFINQKIWKNSSPEIFINTLFSFLNKPTSVWNKAFNNLKPFAKYALLVLVTMRDAHYDEWQAAYKFFCKVTRNNLDLKYEDGLWKETVNILQNCFIKIKRNESKENIVTPYNASIIDFCISHISNKDNNETISLLLKSILYPEQLITLFTSDNIDKRKITISEEFFTIIDNTLQEISNGFKSRKYTQRKETIFYNMFLRLFQSYCNSRKGFIEKIYNYDELFDKFIHSSFRFNMMKNLNWEYSSIKPEDILIFIGQNEDLDLPEWCDYVETAITLGLTSSVFKNRKICYNIIEQIMIEIDLIDNLDDLEDAKNRVSFFDYLCFKQSIDLHTSLLLSYISDKEEQLQEEEETISPDDGKNIPIPVDKDDISIHEMFTSLYDTAEE